MDVPFEVRTLRGMRGGGIGDYLVEDSDTGDRYVVPRRIFEDCHYTTEEAARPRHEYLLMLERLAHYASVESGESIVDSFTQILREHSAMRMALPEAARCCEDEARRDPESGCSRRTSAILRSALGEPPTEEIGGG